MEQAPPRRGADREAHSRWNRRARAARQEGDLDLLARRARRAWRRSEGAARCLEHGRRKRSSLARAARRSRPARLEDTGARIVDGAPGLEKALAALWSPAAPRHLRYVRIGLETLRDDPRLLRPRPVLPSASVRPDLQTSIRSFIVPGLKRGSIHCGAVPGGKSPEESRPTALVPRGGSVAPLTIVSVTAMGAAPTHYLPARLRSNLQVNSHRPPQEFPASASALG